MGATPKRTVHGLFLIRDLNTDEIVHSVVVHYPYGSRMWERVEREMLMKVDLERFYLDWKEASSDTD